MLVDTQFFTHLDIQYFTHCSRVSNVDFEQVNASWASTISGGNTCSK